MSAKVSELQALPARSIRRRVEQVRQGKHRDHHARQTGQSDKMQIIGCFFTCNFSIFTNVTKYSDTAAFGQQIRAALESAPALGIMSGGTSVRLYTNTNSPNALRCLPTPAEQGCAVGDGHYELSPSNGSLMFTSLLFMREKTGQGGVGGPPEGVVPGEQALASGAF